MKSQKREVYLANVSLHIGEKPLLDAFEKYIWPLIISGRVRGYGETNEFRFHQVSVAVLDGTPVVYGRLVKIQTVRARQTFNEASQQLEPSEEQMKTAPSSLFVLNLVNHKLAFLREIVRAPSLRDFKYSLNKLLILDWEVRYSEIKKQLQVDSFDGVSGTARSKLISQAALLLSEPPELHIEPLVSKADLDTQLAKYKTIFKLTIIPKKTNNERAALNKMFLEDLSKEHKTLNSKTTKLTIENKKDGLNLDEARNIVRNSADGNFEVKLSGLNEEGGDVKGDLREATITLKLSIENNQPIAVRAAKALHLLQEMIKNEKVTVAPVEVGTDERALSLVKKLFGEEIA